MIALVLSTLLVALPAAQEKPPQDFPFDPVAFATGEELAGDPALTVTAGGFRYRFANAANRDRFQSDPERWGVQLGGSCARMGPLAGAGRPDLARVHEGRIYVFASEACRTTFDKDPAQALETDDPVPAGTQEQMAAGRALVEKAVAGLGGGAKLDALAGYREVVLTPSVQGDETVLAQKARTFVFPNRYRRDDDWGSWRWAVADDGEQASFIMNGRVEPLAADQRRALAREALRHPLALLRHRDQAGFVAVAHASTELEGEPVDQVAIAYGGVTATLALDPATGRLAAFTCRARGPRMLLGRLQTVYTSHKTISGLTLPTTSRQLFDGEPVPSGDETLAEIDLDPRVPQGFFGPGA